MFDTVAIISENIWHDQQLDRNEYASLIFTGTLDRYIEKPAITPTVAIPPITSGAAAPAVNGRNDKNVIQNFFRRFIVFNYIIFCPKCDIIEKININQRMYFFKKTLLVLMFMAIFCAPVPAHASIVDALNLSPFVPMVLDALMMVATGTYEFFVGTLLRPGIIQVLIWLFLGFTLMVSLAKMYIPKKWLGFIGISGGGELADGKITGIKVVENVAKPCFRALVASIFLLQIKARSEFYRH